MIQFRTVLNFNVVLGSSMHGDKEHKKDTRSDIHHAWVCLNGDGLTAISDKRYVRERGSLRFFRALPRKLHVVRKVGVVGVRVGYSCGVKMRRALPRDPHIVKNCGVVGAADRNSHGLKVGRSGMETHGRSKYIGSLRRWSNQGFVGPA